ncbi:unnamed protein product [Closterium sp. NIES-65]|nr:unnamed protein product [Closterium sp. NIES-65]
MFRRLRALWSPARRVTHSAKSASAMSPADVYEGLFSPRTPMPTRVSRMLFDRLLRFAPPEPLLPILIANAAGFYTGITLAAITEQRYKEAYWEEHPGEAVPLMRSSLYFGKYRIRREDFSEEGEAGTGGGGSGAAGAGGSGAAGTIGAGGGGSGNGSSSSGGESSR